MNENNIPFQVIDWEAIKKDIYPGRTGTAFWQTVNLPALRMRTVEYVAGYVADHWCQKGILFIALKES